MRKIFSKVYSNKKKATLWEWIAVFIFRILISVFIVCFGYSLCYWLWMFMSIPIGGIIEGVGNLISLI